MKKSSATRSSPAAKNSKRKAAGPSNVATPKKAPTTPKKGHPTFAAMICEAIADIEGTVSRPAIAKWIKDHYDVTENQFAIHLKNGLAKAEDEGKIVKVKASYKLTSGKKAKEGSITKKVTPKRKTTTPKSKKPAKKRRTEKESESEGPDDEEDDEEEPEQNLNEIESQEGSGDEASHETDAGPMEDITAEKPAGAETLQKSVSADAMPSNDVSNEKDSAMPGHTEKAIEEPEIESPETSDERSDEMAVVEGTKQPEASNEDEPLAESPSDSKVESHTESASIDVEADVENADNTVVDDAVVAIGTENVVEVTENTISAAEQPSHQGEPVPDVRSSFEPTESPSKPNEEYVAEIPATKPGADEVLVEGTEQQYDAAATTTVSIPKEETHVDADTVAPGAEDAMAVEAI